MPPIDGTPLAMAGMLARVPFVVVLLGVLGLVGVAMALRLAAHVLCLAARGALIGLVLVALVSLGPGDPAAPFPRAALAFARRGGVVAYRAAASGAPARLASAARLAGAGRLHLMPEHLQARGRDFSADDPSPPHTFRCTADTCR